MSLHSDSTDTLRLADINTSKGQRDDDTTRQYIRVTGSVERPMNSHGALWLSAVDGHQTFQVVDYATNGVRQTLASAVNGTTVRVQLVALGGRGDAWRVVAVAPTDHSERPCLPSVSVED